MKKFLSFVLVLVMVMSLSVTAFAEGEQSGTTTLTANIPNAAEPSYTLHLPANTTLTYGNTEMQQVSGKMYVENAQPQPANGIRFYAPYTDLVNTADSSDTIPMKLWLDLEDSGEPYFVDPEYGDTEGWGPTPLYSTYWDSYYSATFYAQVEDWSGATPGATYQSVITFQVWAD